MTSATSSYVPYIPGITGVYGSTSATAAYAIINKNMTKDTQLVQSAPVVQANTTYFANAVKGMKTVNDLLNDPRALDYVLTAYGLDSDSSEMGIIKEVLTQDPTNQASLVNQLADPRWKQMATDLNLYANGLKNLQGTTTTQTYDPVTFSNQYLQLQNQDSTGDDQGDYYTNNATVTINSTNGDLQSSQGYDLMGIKLDNLGNDEQPIGQSVANQTLTVSVPASSADGGGQTNVTEAFTNNNNGTWDWKITDPSGNVLSDQNVTLTFNADGSLSTINGLSTLDASGNPTNTTLSTTLNWADGTSSTQSFDFSQAFQPTVDGLTGYQTSDTRPIDVNWFNGSSTPTTTITPNAVLNSQQQMAGSTTSYSNVQSIPSDQPNVQAAVTQTLIQQGDGSWDWKVTNSDGTVLSDQNLALTFNSDGSLATVNGSSTTTLSPTLTWGDGGTTTQSFDLGALVSTSDFSENVNAIDNIGISRALTLNYSKISNTQNLWQVNVVDGLTGKTATSTDVLFNSNGQVQSVGQYNASTGVITGTDGSPDATSTTFNVTWGNGNGTSNLTLDLSSLQSNNAISQELQPVKTDSVALGARQAVNIGQDGTVSAVYAKADGSGNVTIPLYRLAVNNFQDAGGLQAFGSTGYYTAGPSVGTDTVQPLGAQADSFGNVLPDQAGDLTKNPTTTTTTNELTTLEGKYDQTVLQEAVGQDNPAVRYALYFAQSAPTITNVDGIIADAVDTSFVETTFGIPQAISEQSITTQEQVFGSSVNVKQLTNKTYVNQLISQFLAASDAEGDPGSSVSTNPAVTLVTNGVAGTSGTDLSSSLLSFVGQNINTLA